jgi:predicted DNA-binding transcriptional regulator AlpA
MSSASSNTARQLAQLMTVPEMLAALGGSVSRDTFYKWRQTGKGPRCFALPNGELRCRLSDFLDWLDNLEGRVA